MLSPFVGSLRTVFIISHPCDLEKTVRYFLFFLYKSSAANGSQAVIYKVTQFMYNVGVERDRMQKHLFLTGPAGYGKSEMIKRALWDKLPLAGGFVTVRVPDEAGKIAGLELLPSAAAGGVEGFEGERFLDCSVVPNTHDNEVFRTAGVRLLKEAEYYPFAVLDEFGGFELLVPEFREALLDLLSDEQPCIGILKSLPDAEALKRQLSLGDRYTKLLSSLTEALRNDPDTLILEVSGPYDEKALRAVQAWAKEYT